ncbi:MAG: hypothetical protein V4674_01755 [Patescibacteria group bacterium]
MTRTQKIIGAGIAILLLGGLFAFFIFRNNSSNEGGAGASDASGLFPTSDGTSVSQTGGRGSSAALSLDGNVGEGAALPSDGAKLTSGRVAGMVAFGGDDPFVRYAEKDTGHIFDRHANADAAIKISNTTIVQIAKAIWSPDGKTVVFQIDSNIGAYTHSAYALPSASSTEISLTPIAFPRGVVEFAFSPDGKELFFLRGSGAGVKGLVVTLSTRKEREIWSSPLSEWQISWTDPRQILLTTKASSGIEGVALSIDPKTGTERLLAEGTAGIQALLSPDGKRLLVTENSSAGLRTKMVTLSLGSSYEFDPVTLLEKCTWGKTSTLYCAAPLVWPATALPDAWYKGLFHTADALWGFSRTGFIEKLFDGTDGKRGFIDIINLTPDENDRFVYFINKADQTLWRVQIDQEE